MYALVEEAIKIDLGMSKIDPTYLHPPPISHVVLSHTAVVVPKAEKLLKVSIQPYISSILDALMEPTSRGFSEVRELFFKELVDMSKNTLNEGTKETIAQVRN